MREIEKGTDPRKAELKAVRKVCQEMNSSTTLSVWKKYGLFPAPEEILSDRIAELFGADESNDQRRNGLSVISGGGSKKVKSLKERPERCRPEFEVSERVVLQGVRKILDSIEVHHREWTGGRNREYSTLKTRVIAGRLPIELINEINRLQASKTFHLERALRLYVMVMGSGS